MPYPYRKAKKTLAGICLLLTEEPDPNMPSTAIERFDYEESRQVLRVVFRSGAVYEYHDVPEAVYLNFKRAKSKGRFLNRVVKGSFDFKKVSGE